MERCWVLESVEKGEVGRERAWRGESLGVVMRRCRSIRWGDRDLYTHDVQRIWCFLARFGFQFSREHRPRGDRWESFDA